MFHFSVSCFSSLLLPCPNFFFKCFCTQIRNELIFFMKYERLSLHVWYVFYVKFGFERLEKSLRSVFMSVLHNFTKSTYCFWICRNSGDAGFFLKALIHQKLPFYFSCKACYSISLPFFASSFPATWLQNIWVFCILINIVEHSAIYRNPVCCAPKLGLLHGGRGDGSEVERLRLL